jgi:hypothetical protein
VADFIFATSAAERAGALATSKKWTQVNRTVRFAQEIYDQAGRLVGIHEKFPIDLGHKQL